MSSLPAHRAGLAAAGTVLLWASAFPAIAVAVPRFGPFGLSVARPVVASLALAVAAPSWGCAVRGCGTCR